MNMMRHILGRIWVLEVVMTPDSHSIAAYRCTARGRGAQTQYDAAVVARAPSVITVAGHGTVTKPAGSQVAERVRNDRDTFLWSEQEGNIAFVRRTRLLGLLDTLSAAGIHPLRIEVAVPPAAAAERALAALRWRMILQPTEKGSSLAQTLIRRIALPVSALLLCMLAANAVLAPGLGARRQTLQAQIAARESTAATAADVTARQRVLLEEYGARPALSYAILCDRIAAAVPQRVILTLLAAEPLTKRFEAGKPLLRQERTVLLAGTAPAAADISAFVERLSAEPCCRNVRLTNVERERDADRLVFRIEISI